MLHIKNVSVCYQDKKILQNITLSIAPGTIHVLMGPNGSGKSSLAHALIGYPGYVFTKGAVQLYDDTITNCAIEKRAQKGLFLAFQYPCALPGVSVIQFLIESYRALGNTIDDMQLFDKKIKCYAQLLAIDLALLDRSLHDGFSGGEKKKFELLQLLVLQPNVAILDEIDSGLDVDALIVIAKALAVARKENPRMSLIIITHYQRILEYIRPDYVHVIASGTVVASGDYLLAKAIDKRGYDEYCK